MSRRRGQPGDTLLVVDEARGSPRESRAQDSVAPLGEDLHWAEFPSGSSLRSRVRALATAAVRPLMVRRARRYVAGGRRQRLHLGCGQTMLAGWLNVDLVGRQPVDLALDLRKRLPFPDGSIDAVFHEHLIEHMTYQDALALLSECARVLGSGGTLRVTVPDFGRYLTSYVQGTEFIESVRPGRLSRLIALSEVVYCHGHRSVWDAETLGGVLEGLGLPAQQMEGGHSRLQPCPDAVSRRNETLYMEGVKPR